jgi:hypothetical protein
MAPCHKLRNPPIPLNAPHSSRSRSTGPPRRATPRRSIASRHGCSTAKRHGPAVKFRSIASRHGSAMQHGEAARPCSEVPFRGAPRSKAPTLQTPPAHSVAMPPPRKRRKLNPVDELGGYELLELMLRAQNDEAVEVWQDYNALSRSDPQRARWLADAIRANPGTIQPGHVPRPLRPREQ